MEDDVERDAARAFACARASGALATSDISFIPFPQIVIANFTVGGAPVSMSIPTTLPTPTGELSHPFRIHVNSFEIVSINDVPLATPTFGDTVLIPSNGTVVIRSRFKEFAGKSVFDCHICPMRTRG